MIYRYIILIIIKHFIADVYIQDGETSRGKRLPGWEGFTWLMWHSVPHAVGTALIVGIVQLDLLLAIGLGCLDCTLHVAIDKLKVILENIFEIRANSWQWYLLSIVDQTLHFSCYVLYGIILFI